MQLEFVSHPFSVFIPFPGVLRAKQTIVSDGPECVWEPLREGHHGWQIPNVLCAPIFRPTHRRMPGAQPPVLAPCPVHQSRLVIQSAEAISNYLKKSVFGATISFAEIPHREILPYRSTSTATLSRDFQKESCTQYH